MRRCQTLVSDTAILVLGVVLMGCEAGQARLPRIRYGQDICARCRMIISEERFAAALVNEAGEPAVFDSIECLIQDPRARKPAGAMWVHDYESDHWLDARSAWFVRSPKLLTPMGGGLIAVAGADAAHRIAGQVTGEVMEFAHLTTE